jgi:hypothetical protein
MRMDLKAVGAGWDSIHGNCLAQNVDKWRPLLNKVVNLLVS